MTETELNEKMKRIRLVILDVDGVLSDGAICIGNEGECFKRFHVRDGLGIKMLQKAGIPIAIITGRSSKIVEERARELGIELLFQNERFKVPAYERLLEKLGLRDDEVAYMGDDVPDLALLKRAGFACCPADADHMVVPFVDFQAPFNGGRGAVRAMAEKILRAQGVWEELIEKTYVNP